MYMTGCKTYITRPLAERDVLIQKLLLSFLMVTLAASLMCATSNSPCN